MKAVQAKSYGGPEVLEIKVITQPKPQKNQVLVEIYAAGINPFDLHILSGSLQKMMPLKFPMTFGGDFAGIIKDPGDSEYKSGDEVFGSAIVLSGGSGSFAEYAVASINKVAYKPKSVSFNESASLPVAGLTGVEAVLDQIKLQKGQKILIHGGAGGVGHFAVQEAKHLGGFVATTVSGKDIDWIKKLGADIALDYRKHDFSQLLKDYDAVLDLVGGDAVDKSYSILKPGGIFVTTVGQINEELGKKLSVHSVRQSTVTDAAHYQRLATFVDEGDPRPHIDKVFTLDQVREAITYLQTGHPRGKVVIEIKNNSLNY